MRVPGQDKMVADALRGSWVHRFLPEPLWPYAQLARWERPIGWRLLMWPCWWSVMLAANHQAIVTGAPPDWPRLGLYLLLFTLGAVIMRGAGCTYNDLADEDIDEKVARTRSRPLPSGRVSRRQAMVFLALQLLAGLLVLVQFNRFAIIIGFVSMITVIVYPFMKRITWWPQLFLGFAFSWGALMGWSAWLAELSPPPLLLYLGSICWVIGYDTIYAHQDIEDDALVGVKSTARLFGARTHVALFVLYGAALTLFAAAFWTAAMPPLAWLGLLGAALHMGWQIRVLDIADPALCLRLFKSNSHLGWLMFFGLAAALLVSSAR